MTLKAIIRCIEERSQEEAECPHQYSLIEALTEIDRRLTAMEAVKNED